MVRMKERAPAVVGQAVLADISPEQEEDVPRRLRVTHQRGEIGKLRRMLQVWDDQILRMRTFLGSITISQISRLSPTDRCSFCAQAHRAWQRIARTLGSKQVWWGIVPGKWAGVDTPLLGRSRRGL